MKVLGHRGFVSGQAYQNSMAAFAEAFAHTDGLETDLAYTKDGHIVLIHNTTCKNGRTLNAADEHLDEKSVGILAGRYIHELTSAELSELRLRDGQSIPTLDALVRATPQGKMLNLELKVAGVENLLIPQLQHYFCEGVTKPEQILVSSFNHEALVAVREVFPEMHIGMLWASAGGTELPFSPESPENGITFPRLNKMLARLPLVEKIQPQYFIIPHNAATTDTLGEIRNAIPSVQVIVWEHSEMNSAERPVRAFVDAHKNAPWLAAVIVDAPL